MLAVTVNDKPLAVSAIVERGRVLLPMRATFTALGATVSYDGRARAVVARNATHTLRLPVSTLRMVANHAYVPLRFVAQAMGAFVTYSARTRIVSVTTTSDAPATVRVTALDPPDGASVSTAYPTISATLDGENAARGDVTLRIDGTDVSELSSFDGSTITFMPRRGFSRGSHQVVFAGRTASGHAFSAQWSFATTLAAPPDVGPAMSSNYGYRFYVNGLDSFYPGNWMHFVLVAPPGGSAVLQLCNLGYQYAFWNGGFGTTYQANVLAPYGYWVPSCQVTAIYTAWNGVQKYVPLQIGRAHV